MVAIVAGMTLYISSSVFVERSYCKNLSEISLSESDRRGNQKIQDLIKQLEEGDSYDRQRAAMELGTSGNTVAVEPLIEAFNDEDNFVRDFAPRALGNICDTRAVAPLIKTLNDEHLLVRRSAALALGSLGDTRAVNALIRALNSEDFMLRRAAAKALGYLGDTRAVAPLIGALGDEDAYIQSGAAAALADIGEPALAELVDALSDWTTGPRVAEILRDLNWQPLSAEDRVRLDVATRNRRSLLSNWETAKKVLMNDADSENSRKDQNAVSALIGIGREEVVDELIEILGEKGTREMVNAFWDCGNDHLHEAARDWARKHEHEDELETEDERPIVEWGRMKSG